MHVKHTFNVWAREDTATILQALPLLPFSSMSKCHNSSFGRSISCTNTRDLEHGMVARACWVGTLVY